MEVSPEKSVQQETVGLKGTWASSGRIDSDGEDESAILDALSILEYLEPYGDIVSTGTIISFQSAQKASEKNSGELMNQITQRLASVVTGELARRTVIARFDAKCRVHTQECRSVQQQPGQLT